MDPASFLLIRTTFPSREKAVEVSHHLLEKRLVACCNITDNVTSVYEWEGTIHTINEVILSVKTTTQHWDEVEKALKDLSPWKCPAIVAWPFSKASCDFLEWIQMQTA